MDDDIRDRFRGVSRGARTSAPSQTQRPEPKPRPEPPKPTPAKPTKPKKPRRKRSKNFKLAALLVLGLLLIAGGAYLFFRNRGADKSFEQEIQTPQTQTEEAQPTGSVRLVAVGDSLAFDSINSAAKQPDSSINYLPMMSEIKPFFAKSDIRLCNQITPGGGGEISGYPSFNAPVEWSKGFAGLGCNVVNLASDHMNDKGQGAIDTTRSTWDDSKDVLAVAGANKSAEQQSKIVYFTVKNLKFAYLAYTTNTLNKSITPHGINQYNDDTAASQIAEARKQAKFVIVSMHWGVEDAQDINADQDRIAQHLASQGADLVVGSGPRVIQPAKLLSGKDGGNTLVWFSLGNFLNSQLPINNLIGGMAVVDIDVATQEITGSSFMPVYMHYEWTAAQKTARDIDARHDFKLYPLDLAAEPLARSQNNTTVEAQTARVTGIITQFTPIKVIKSTDF